MEGFIIGPFHFDNEGEENDVPDVLTNYDAHEQIRDDELLLAVAQYDEKRRELNDLIEHATVLKNEAAALKSRLFLNLRRAHPAVAAHVQTGFRRFDEDKDGRPELYYVGWGGVR